MSRRSIRPKAKALCRADGLTIQLLCTAWLLFSLSFVFFFLSRLYS